MIRTLTRAAAVAGFALTAVAAQAAQTFDVKFNFSTPAGEHAAGTYVVDVRDNTSGATKFVHIRNRETGKTLMFLPSGSLSKVNAKDTPPRLAFKCGSNSCRLAEVWTDAWSGWSVRQPKLTPAEAERLAVVSARTTSAE